LLLIGCNFPDWLTRFILHATNKTRLSDAQFSSWLIEPLKEEESLTCFLHSYSKQLEILSKTTPVEFVAELNRRWMAMQGAAASRIVGNVNQVIPSTMFFLSYFRHTDRPSVEKLRQTLLDLGVSQTEVWFDESTVEPGDNFKELIIDGIQGCRYFLPLLSEAVDNRSKGFVFREWEAATDLIQERNYADFLIPVVVDSAFDPEKYTNRWAKGWRDSHINFGNAPDGVPNEMLRKKLKNLVYDARVQSGAA
jgi:hypothetical protein